MSLTPANPGGWSIYELLTSDQANHLQGELLKAIDGQDGGTYTLLDDLVFAGVGEVQVESLLRMIAGSSVVADSGSSVTVDGELILSVADGASLSGALTVTNTGSVTVAAGGELILQDGADATIELGATLTVDDGGLIDLDGAMTVGGAITVLSGGAITVDTFGIIEIDNGGDLIVRNLGDMLVETGGQVTFESGAELAIANPEDVTIDDASVVFRVDLTPAQITETGGVPDFRPFVPGLPTWLMTNATADGFIVFKVKVQPGDVITTMRVLLRGEGGGVAAGHSGVVGTPPRATLFEMTPTGTSNVIVQANDPVAYPAYDNDHAIPLAGGLLPYTVTGNPLYISIRSEGGANAESDTTLITDIDGTLLARRFRGLTEVK